MLKIKTSNLLKSTSGLSAVTFMAKISNVQLANFNLQVCVSKGKFWMSMAHSAITIALGSHRISPWCVTIAFLWVRLSIFSFPLPLSALEINKENKSNLN